MQQFITNYGYLAIFVLMLAESACIPVPSELIMTFGGALAAGAVPGTHLNLIGVILAGTAGNVAGSYIAWAVGRYGGQPLLRRLSEGRLGRHLLREHDLDRAIAWFDRHGGKAVLIGRLLPVVRTFISLPAGIAEMPALRFGIYTTIGCIPWTTALAVAGYAVGTNWESIANAFHGPSYIIAAIVLVVMVLAVWRYARRRRTEVRPEAARARTAAARIARDRVRGRLRVFAIMVEALFRSDFDDRQDRAARGTGWPGSAAGEGGFAGAVFQEAAHAGLLVLGAEQRGELHPLDLQAGGQVDAEAGVDGLLGGAQRERGAAGVAPHHVQGRLVDRVVRHHLVHQADLQRLGRADHPAAEHDVLGPGRADQAGQPLRSAGPGDDAEQDLGLADPGPLPRDAEIGGEGELEPAAQRVAGDRGDHRLGQGGDQARGFLQPPGPQRHLGVAASAMTSMSAPPQKTFSPP